MFDLKKQFIKLFKEVKMKVNPRYITPPTTPFRGKVPMKPAALEKSKQFFEAAGIVAMTSLPMFMFVQLQNVFRKTFGAKSDEN